MGGKTASNKQSDSKLTRMGFNAELSENIRPETGSNSPWTVYVPPIGTTMVLSDTKLGCPCEEEECTKQRSAIATQKITSQEWANKVSESYYEAYDAQSRRINAGMSNMIDPQWTNFCRANEAENLAYEAQGKLDNVLLGLFAAFPPTQGTTQAAQSAVGSVAATQG